MESYHCVRPLAAASSRSVGPGKPDPRLTSPPSNSPASWAWADLSLLTASDPVLTAAAMSTRRSCIRPTEHIAPRLRHTCQTLRVNHRKFGIYVDMKPNRYPIRA